MRFLLRQTLGGMMFKWIEKQGLPLGVTLCTFHCKQTRQCQGETLLVRGAATL